MADEQRFYSTVQAWTFVHDINMDDVERERAIARAYDRARWDEFFDREGAFKEGENKKAAEIAKDMLAAGEPRAKILQFTRLTELELDRLQ